MSKETHLRTSRRAFMGIGAAGLTALMAGTEARAAKLATKARIVSIGAGAAGTALANRLVERLEGAEITLVDGRKEHVYQPGLSLVAAGRTNRQIGDELFVSVKTASVHVSNILRKLGVNSRVDAAAVAQRLGLD